MTAQTYTVTEQLQELLAEPLASVKEREVSALEKSLSSVENRVVIFGAGNLGRRTAAALRKIGVRPLAFSDNNPRVWNTEIEGCPVLSPQEAARQFGGDALFIVAIWNASHFYGDTKQRLLEKGCKKIGSVSPVYWRFADEFLPFFCQDLPHKVYQEADSVLAASAIWSDEQSRNIYLSQIRWRALGEWDSFRSPDPEESYFTESLFSLLADEDFVDCGAFDGDTIRSLVQRRGSDFRSVLAIEADAMTFPKLQSYLEELEPQIRKKITALYVAVAAERGTIRFMDSGGVDSRISESGTTEVECYPLDELLRDRRASYIKMDIEGAEHDALLGAFGSIERDRPVLSVCVYHSQNDIWRLPLLVQRRVKGYAFFLREHEGDGWQTVLYAVPRERLNPAKLS